MEFLHKLVALSSEIISSFWHTFKPSFNFSVSSANNSPFWTLIKLIDSKLTRPLNIISTFAW